MINYLWRLAKRFAILLPGVAITYLSIHVIVPELDKRLPLGLAIFVTYVLAAYVLIPAALRVARVFFPPRHLPLYCITPDGLASDPLNVGIVGSRDELIAAMTAAGWFMADEKSMHTVTMQIISALANRPYPEAPMSSLYLFGRKQDIGFEMPITGERGHRHHVRFWATTFRKGQPISQATIQWAGRPQKLNGRDQLWLGAASRDIGFAVIKHNVQVTHLIHPDTVAERRLIVDQLLALKRAKIVATVRLGRPYRLENRALGGHLTTDGRLEIIRLT